VAGDEAVSRDQHGFHFSIEQVFYGDSFDDCKKRAIESAKHLYQEMENSVHIIVTETGFLTMEGSDGVFCEGCADHTIPGVRWPTIKAGDATRSWVEKCDWCDQVANDYAALRKVLDFYDGTDAVSDHGFDPDIGFYAEVP
jgi:hypothetical protein